MTNEGFPVLVVDYDDRDELYYSLLGITVLISTIPGTTQIPLIDAAIRAGVSRFAPAEFEGLPALRPQDDALDNGKAAVLAHLHNNAYRLEYTCFVCGMLYENFAPDGLYISSKIGQSSPISGEGDYLMNVKTMTAELPPSNAAGEQVLIRMTAGQDVGKFVARAINLLEWPPVLTMSGERISMQQLLRVGETTRNQTFYPNLRWCNAQDLHAELGLALSRGDTAGYRRVLMLLATQEGRFDFEYDNLNNLFPDVVPLRFDVWLTRVWNEL